MQNSNHGDEQPKPTQSSSDARPAGEADIGPRQHRIPETSDESSKSGGNRRAKSPRNVFARLSINECLTLLVGIGSLVVSFLTYELARDTSDLKKAVESLKNMATAGGKQVDALHEQLTIIKAQQRPWLKARIELAGDLIHVANMGLIAPIKIKVTNVGQTPAFSVYAEAFTYLHLPGEPTLSVKARQMCDLHKLVVATSTNYGQVIFPGETKSDWGFPTLTIEDANWGGFRLTGNRTPVEVYGCVTYQIGQDGSPHETDFAFTLAKVSKDISGASTFQPGFLRDEPVNARDIVVWDSGAFEGTTN